MGLPTGLYTRISADREGRELGVQRQREDGRALAEKQGDFVIEEYSDNDISASTRSKKKRPEFERMIADAKAGRIKKIVAYKSSRLTRRPRENEDLIELAERYGVVFAYVASPAFDLNTASGRMVARVLAAQDASEAEGNAEQARRKKLQAATAGEWRGGRRPFGYEADGVTVRPVEARMVADASARVLAGESLYSIARDFTASGVPTSSGSMVWRQDCMSRLLKRARNAAIIEHDGQEVGPAQWEPIVEESTWRAARALLSDPARRSNPGSSRRLLLGTGLYLCGICDDGTTVRSVLTRGARSHPLRRAYSCKARAHLVRVAAPVDDLVEHAVVDRLLQPDAADLVVRHGGSEVDVVELRSRATALRKRIDELDDELDDGVLTKDRWARRNARLTGQLEEVQADLARAAGTSPLKGLAGNPDLECIWWPCKDGGHSGHSREALPVSRRAAAVNDLVVVTLLKAPRGRRPGGGYFDPSCVDITWR